VNTAFDFFPNPLDSLKFFPNPPNELVGVCVRRMCVCLSRLGNACCAFEMLTLLLKYSPRVGNARRALEVLSTSA